MKIKIIISLIIISTIGFSQWAINTGGTSFDEGYGIAVDGSGNSYITGIFQGTVDFDPGAGTANLTSAGSIDAFVAKYDASGNYVWAIRFGSVSIDYGYGIAVDGSGNSYVTGSFVGIVDFDPGPGTANLVVSGFADAYVAKYDASGNYVWAKKLGGTSTEEGRGIAVDGSGNSYVTGIFAETVDFDPGAGTANLTSAGSNDAFVAKYDASGNYVWAKSVGATSSDIGRGIAVDDSGNSYVTGYFQGTADFDPGTGTANLTSAGGTDVFVAKYDASGNYVWAMNVAGTSHDYGYAIAVDGSGNSYVTGTFKETADFDPGAGTANLSGNSFFDIYIAKYDVSGNYVWAKKLGGTFHDYGYGIALDGSGNSYVTGNFVGTSDFDPGAGTANLTSNGYFNDIFIAKYDASGNYVWAKNVGATSHDYGYGIALDGSGNSHVTGSFQGTVDFDPGAGTSNLTSAGVADVFVAKYNPTGEFTSSAPEIRLKQGTDVKRDGAIQYFGQKAIGSNTDVVLTIENLGTADLTLTTPLTLTGTDASEFSIQSQPTSPVTAGGTTTFIVRFSPTSRGAKTATLAIANNDSDENPYDITITGWGKRGPEMTLKQGTNGKPDGGSYSFGRPDTGSDTDVVFTIGNNGNADLTLTTPLTIGGTDASEFSIVAQPTSPVISKGTTTFTVRYSPSSRGAKTATLAIANNDGNEDPYDLTLNGGSSAPEMTLKQGTNGKPDGGSYSFRRQDTGSDTDVVFTIGNNGNADLTLTTPLTIGGTDASEFSIQAQPTSPVISKGTTTFTVRFSPTSAGAKTATLAIANNDGNEDPYDLTLNGRAVLNVNPTAYPNPFNPITTIQYGLDTDSRVNIVIYDVSGRLIATLVDKDQSKGLYSVIWNGTNHNGEKVPAGIYLSRITSNEQTKIVKLMLLK